MKSSALHLIVTLMLALLLVGPLTVLPLTAASVSTALPAAPSTTPLPSTEPAAASASVASTVQPSAYQQQRRRLVTSSPQTPPTTTMASSPAAQRSAAAGKRQRELIARHSRRGSWAAAPTNPPPPSSSSPPPPRQSARRASSATAPQPLAVGVAEERARPRSSGVRQNRSLQSASATVLGHSGNSAGDGDYERKRPERRRINQYTSGGGAVSSVQKATSSSATATTTPKTTTTTSKATTTTSKATTTTSKTTTTPTTTTPNSKPDGRLSVVAAANHRQAKQVDAEPPSRERQTKRAQATLKSPRMIQRMVAGHIQNAEGRSTYQISAVSTNSTVTAVASEAASTSASYQRRKESMQSSSYRKATTTTTTTTPTTTTITKTPPTATSEREEDDDRDDDEALLDSLDDLDNWDNGILRLSAGSGKESTKSKKAKDDGKTKTLSDQVKDGKYGLIEKELFSRPPKRPGVLSYLRNKEVPADNERNYGGLRDEDIWLAEDHLLVIKGGTLNDEESNEPWPPIDDFESPPRQIKIPADAKVPPPFPVQLEPDGPLQFIGNNKFTLVYPVANESVPVYPAGPAPANDTPPPGDGDDAPNSLARPGSPAGAAPSAGYLYPPAAPPWLYHNQTFVNPVLSNARPISFPSLGPFPYGRLNASHFNGSADEFDEDDPSLYYPPAYSFVYKSNYTNPVPAGPLVPGIVLPPPADQFSRLEKPEKEGRPSTSPPPPPVVRHRPITTSTSTTTLLPITTTTTTTTSTTPPSPIYRPVYTKIYEYTPKTIVITPEPPTTKSPPPTPPPRHHPTPSPPPSRIQSVPVAVGVPIPVYPSHRPDIVSFVPTTADPGLDTFSKSNPIYYEYFEAKRQPSSSSSLNAIDNFRGSTPKTPPQSTKPIKIYATSKRPFKTSHQQPGRNYLQPPNQHLQPVGQQQQQRPYLQDNIVYITPKPEIRYNVAAAPPQQPIFKPRPLENFEREVDELRETLRYYHNQQLRDNTIPRTPKAKPVYEYAYDGNKQQGNNNQQQQQQQQQSGDEGKFQPSGFDEEPFKPMVTYSPPVGDENAFRAIAYDKVDNEVPQSRQLPDSKYPTTTTLVPVQPDPQYQQTGRPKKLRLRAKYLQPSQLGANTYEQQQQGPVVIGDYQTTPRVVVQQAGGQWQEFNEYGVAARQPQKSQRLQLPPQRHRGFNGYYYNAPPPPPLLPPQQHPQQQQQQYTQQQQQQQYPQQQQQPSGHRQNNRFYDEPFQGAGPQRKIVTYGGRPQQQQWSLENDTYVNYAPNRPPLNPDAEFIDPYQPVNVYAQQPPQRQPVAPPPLSHQSQYYSTLPQRYNSPRQQQQQQQQQQTQQQLPPHPQQQQIPLHRDILVNYRDPLPPINPDSEYISHPQVVRNQATQVYRPHAYRGGDQASVYYISPKYRRSPTSSNGENEPPSDSSGK